MQNSNDKLITDLIGVIWDNPRDQTGKSNGSKDDVVILVYLALIAAVATEPFKIIMRKNVGKLAIGMMRIVISAILYFVWGVLLLIFSNKEDYLDFSNILTAGAVVFIILSFMTIILGKIEYDKASEKSLIVTTENIMKQLYRGDSVFFGFLLKKGWRIEKVWTIIEPLSCLIVGFLLCFIHPLIGLPIVVSSLSFAFNEWYQVNNVKRTALITLEKAQLIAVQRQTSYEDEETVRISL